MKEELKQIIRKMQSGIIRGKQLEEKEFSVIQELCGTHDKDDLVAIFNALGTSGTMLAVPALCAHIHTEDTEIKAMASVAIQRIKNRAILRRSLLPEIYFTPDHWQSEWQGGISAFLSYVEFISDAYVKLGHDESEVNRIGEILAAALNVDMKPYPTFADFKICQTSWNFELDYQRLLDRMNEEKVVEDLEKMGIMESDISFVAGSLMDLQYDYLIARLKLEGDLDYFRFVFKMAECLNQPVA